MRGESPGPLTRSQVPLREEPWREEDCLRLSYATPRGGQRDLSVPLMQVHASTFGIFCSCGVCLNFSAGLPDSLAGTRRRVRWEQAYAVGDAGAGSQRTDVRIRIIPLLALFSPLAPLPCQPHGPQRRRFGNVLL